jgi:hypothetical protein
VADANCSDRPLDFFFFEPTTKDWLRFPGFHHLQGSDFVLLGSDDVNGHITAVTFIQKKGGSLILRNDVTIQETK